MSCQFIIFHSTAYSFACNTLLLNKKSYSGARSPKTTLQGTELQNKKKKPKKHKNVQISLHESLLISSFSSISIKMLTEKKGRMYLLHDDVEVMGLHILELPILQALLDSSNVVRRCLQIFNYTHHCHLLHRFQNIWNMGHVENFLIVPCWPKPHFLPNTLFFQILPVPVAIFRAKGGLQHIFTQVLFTMHSV
jgi:hypothetical protein